MTGGSLRFIMFWKFIHFVQVDQTPEVTRLKHMVLLFLFMCLLAAGCSPAQTYGDDTSAASTNAEQETTIPLSFEEVKVEQQVTLLDRGKIKQIVKEEQLDTVKLFSFLKVDEDDPLRLIGGIQIGDDLYEFGDVGALHYVDRLDIQTSSLFHKSVIKVEGLCGANCPFRYYITIEEEKPSIFLVLSEPVADIADLDEDGVEEIVTSYGSPDVFHTRIYTWRDNRIVSADVNKLTKAWSVLYTRPFFHVQEQSGIDSARKTYRYTAKGLALVTEK